MHLISIACHEGPLLHKSGCEIVAYRPVLQQCLPQASVMPITCCCPVLLVCCGPMKTVKYTGRRAWPDSQSLFAMQLIDLNTCQVCVRRHVVPKTSRRGIIVQLYLKKKRKITPLGVITGASRPRGSPRLCLMVYPAAGCCVLQVRWLITVLQSALNKAGRSRSCRWSAINAARILGAARPSTMPVQCAF